MTTDDAHWLEPEWPAPRCVHVISTRRTGGASEAPYASFNLAQHVGDDPAAVAANRARLRETGRLPAEPLWLNQVHGTEVVTNTGLGSVQAARPTADASVAHGSGRVCVVMTADCLPVVFADRAGTCIGVSHAGWRGLVAGVLESTIAAMQVPPSDLLAWLGPAIAQAAFEVGGEVREAFLMRSAKHAAAFEPNAGGRYQADLYALARTTLNEAGVGSVHGGGRCTYGERDEFFSFRRERTTGRMATLAWLE